jgi:GrpB-like predicted nucleotidyltransferase (UPF0157 family)
MPDVDEPVHLVLHRAEWASEALREISRIASALSPSAADVEHIGSTAVPGLAAKPVIDLMIGAQEYAPVASLKSTLARLGYEPLGEAGVPGRAYFRLRRVSSFNLHLVHKGGEHWRNNIALRDYLRMSPGARLQYAQAKTAALSSGASTLASYSAAKAAVVAALLDQALAGGHGG